eukprot:CAMPEP_0182460742 /NCGR_PEP_ID=MMETSP1319-20130603/5519_1 /TAXON_ID=172717 /ORGANISM="Bolidomonas pacifica, Strain RCC208" /LENGTH=34 /DNA_ID= /DNA_START= /DNA_END= /DNA_ORIENTATION=
MGIGWDEGFGAWKQPDPLALVAAAIMASGFAFLA